MSSFNYTDDNGTVERLSEQRDDIYEYVVGQFRVHMSNDDIDSAMALADELGVLPELWQHTMTCYRGVPGEGCKESPSCYLRARGLADFLRDRVDLA